MRCHWCKKEIRPDVHPYVTTKVPLPISGFMYYRYHAKVCYRSHREFIELHSFLPLVPEDG